MPEVIKRIWTIYDLTNEFAQIYGARRFETDNDLAPGEAVDPKIVEVWL